MGLHHLVSGSTGPRNSKLHFELEDFFAKTKPIFHHGVPPSNDLMEPNFKLSLNKSFM